MLPALLQSHQLKKIHRSKRLGTIYVLVVSATTKFNNPVTISTRNNESIQHQIHDLYMFINFTDSSTKTTLSVWLLEDEIHYHVPQTLREVFRVSNRQSLFIL